MPRGVSRGRVTPSDRIAEARILTILAVELQSRGILTAAGEMLWGAVNHIITATADHHQLQKDGKPMNRRPVMEHLHVMDPRDPPLENSLVVVAELHGHFYNKFMDDARHTAAIAASVSLVEYLLNRPEVQAISPRP